MKYDFCHSHNFGARPSRYAIDEITLFHIGHFNRHQIDGCQRFLRTFIFNTFHGLTPFDPVI
jgi:hypothetical protein